jgi:hypothetical protein
MTIDSSPLTTRKRCGVAFHPVAGGDDGRFHDAGQGAENGQRAGQFGIRDGKSLAHFDGGGLVAEAQAEDLHRFAHSPAPW